MLADRSSTGPGRGELRPGGLEPPTCWFEASHSIQLSYERCDTATGYARRSEWATESADWNTILLPPTVDAWAEALRRVEEEPVRSLLIRNGERRLERYSEEAFFDGFQGRIAG